MKRFILLTVCLFFGACSTDNKNYYYMEEEITEFVQEYREELCQQIIDADEYGTADKFDGLENIEDRRKSSGVIYYECAASGIVSSSLQAGFYYSVDDKPSPHGGAAWAGGYGWSEVQTQEENLWRYEEDNSDNYLITRKICDNFYYVVAGN